jgi:Fic family protein
MLDSNWDLIDGNTAHDIEVLNYSNQVNVIEALVRFIIHHAGAADDAGCPNYPNEQALKELHRTGTLFLLSKPGEYREGEVHVKTADGVVVHTPPTADQVQARMTDFFARLAERWSGDPIEVAGFTLWMLNWVHPFKNGNGRTARAFCYACLSLKLGFVLPGSPTVIDLIMQQRDEYQAALKVADGPFEAGGEPDLSAMSAFLRKLLVQQLSSVP